MIDERQNLPSASEYHRIAACPGMLNLKRSLGPLPDTAGPDAESGTRIASALAGELNHNLLTDEEHKTFDRLADGRIELRKLVFGEMDDRPIHHESERRLWLKYADESLAFSGRFDAVYYRDDVALVVDDKSGRNEVTKADGNMQLRSLAVLVNMHLGERMFKRVVVAINQPWFTPAYSLAEYDAAALQMALDELMDNLARATFPDAPRKAGAHCTYCPCRAVCPEAQAVVMAVIPAPSMAVATPAELSRFLNWCDEYDPEATIKAAKDEAKRRLSAGEEVPGWSLKPGQIMRPITDSELVFARAEKLGVTYEAFKACVEVGKGTLKDAVKAATGQKGKALDATMETLIEGATTAKPKAPSLVRN